MLSAGTVTAHLKILSLSLMLALSSCLRVGLPEFVSPGAAGDSGVGYEEPARNAIPLDFRARLLSAARNRVPWVLIELPERALASAERPKSLGHQFLLGFIPFTSVFLQHDPESLLVESAVEHFISEGFRVALFTAAAAPQLGYYFGNAYVLRLSLPRLRVNAFDLLILRLADIEGELNMDVASSFAPEVPLKSIRKQVEVSEYRRLAHAPALAGLLERNLSASIRSAGVELPTLRRLRVHERDPQRLVPTVDSAIVLSAPRFLKPPAAGMGTALAASYGFQSRPAFANTSVLRIVHRGLEQGAAAGGDATVSLPHGESEPRGVPPERIIDAGISRIEPSEDGVRLELRLSYRNGSRSAVCAVDSVSASSTDGALVVALERAAAAALQTFLGRGADVGGVACSDG